MRFDPSPNRFRRQRQVGFESCHELWACSDKLDTDTAPKGYTAAATIGASTVTIGHNTFQAYYEDGDGNDPTLDPVALIEQAGLI